ncbi:hypothetical protein ABZV58_05250 [Nocardia sp. NPDC004654]|uniref:hypothetical protein n=1 Tax=Nocardia sp. NPDC004654 TaxID=3154776 RepID=UPI0033A85D1E
MTETITGLTEEDGQTIGFVVSCWYNDVIELAELRKWCEHVIITNEMQDIPHYMFDLVNVDSPGEILDIIGFLPGEVSRQEDRALYGIAFGRGRDVFDPPLSRTAAQRALQARPDVLQRFRDVFPFIELDT